jgi:hypothetical protein
MEAALFQAVGLNDITQMKAILDTTPELNVNWMNELEDRWTALHYASLMGHVEAVSLLLKRGDINVNQQCEGGWTPFFLACWNSKTRVIGVLLKDKRLDCNLADSWGRTPLKAAIESGYLETVKWILTGCTPELPQLLSMGIMFLDICQLVKDFETDPELTRLKIRHTIDLPEVLAARVFALMVLISDGYLELSKENDFADDFGVEGSLKRFLRMAVRLPMELQMVLSNRVFGLMRANVLMKDSEPAFKRMLGQD